MVGISPDPSIVEATSQANLARDECAEHSFACREWALKAAIAKEYDDAVYCVHEAERWRDKTRHSRRVCIRACEVISKHGHEEAAVALAARAALDLVLANASVLYAQQHIDNANMHKGSWK